MFKRISTIFSALCFSATTVLAGLTFPVNASTTYTISTPRQFCEYKRTSDISLIGESALDCSDYSDEVGSELVIQRGLRIDWGDTVIMKDMNLVYDFIRSLDKKKSVCTHTLDKVRKFLFYDLKSVKCIV